MMARSSRLRRVLLAFVLAVGATVVVLVGAARSRNASLAALHRDAAMLVVSAPQFAQASIPDQFSCKGAGHSPALSWSAAPKSTASFLVLMRDQDVPHPYFPIASFDHWLLYDIAPSITSIDANASSHSLSDQHIVSAINSDRAAGYFAPCPPMGRHAYVLSVYALDIAHLAPKDNDAESVLELIKGHVIGYGAVTGMLS
jgi:Raf kinase inhibitor-like YbhB/YbcL family protein